MPDEAPMNREQRRRQKFHRAPQHRQDNLRTQRENSSGFLSEPPADLASEAAAGGGTAASEATTENEKLTTGPGQGGATESAERAPHHEGVHGGPSRKR